MTNEPQTETKLVAPQGEKKIELVKMRVLLDHITVRKPDGQNYSALKDEIIEVDPECARSLETPVSYPYEGAGYVAGNIQPPKRARAVRLSA